MRPFRDSTLGVFAELAVGHYTKSALKMLFLKAGLSRHLPSDPLNKDDLVTGVILSAQRNADDGDEDAIKGLYCFVQAVAECVAHSDGQRGPAYGGLETLPSWKRVREALRADGYDPRYEERVVRLLPLDEPDVPLSEEITALEDDFQQLGMTTALKHYRDATDQLVSEKYESANGALRCMIEDVVCEVAERNGRTRVKAGDGQRALQYLIDEKKVLPNGDGGSFVRGLWQIIQTDGPHPGTTTAGEARFRFQAGTAVARYLIDRFAGPEA
ncbi:hypothetical protein [Streptomyces sp. BH104]|uniref:hypothetical protein n=1 Tax=Streptomyces sp. BH104 TaxID=3410407 RepID=UPI003BB5E149